jgi:hypothetical protein
LNLSYHFLSLVLYVWWTMAAMPFKASSYCHDFVTRDHGMVTKWSLAPECFPHLKKTIWSLVTNIYILYHSNIILIYLYIIIFIIFIIFIYVHSNLISPEQWLIPKVNEQFLSIHDLEVSGFLPPAKARSGDGNAVGDMRMVLQLLEESGKEGLQSAKLTRSGSSHRKLVGFTYINSW